MYGTGGASSGVGIADGFGPGCVTDEALLLLESRLHRPHTHHCQVRAAGMGMPGWGAVMGLFLLAQPYRGPVCCCERGGLCLMIMA